MQAAAAWGFRVWGPRVRSSHRAELRCAHEVGFSRQQPDACNYSHNPIRRRTSSSTMSPTSPSRASRVLLLLELKSMPLPSAGGASDAKEGHVCRGWDEAPEL